MAGVDGVVGLLLHGGGGVRELVAMAGQAELTGEVVCYFAGAMARQPRKGRGVSGDIVAQEGWICVAPRRHVVVVPVERVVLSVVHGGQETSMTFNGSGEREREAEKDREMRGGRREARASRRAKGLVI